MRVRRGIPGGLVIAVAAILAMRSPQLVSRPAQEKQTGRDGKSEGANVEKLLNDNDCRSCHAIDRKVMGPSYSEVAGRYAAQANAAEKLARTIREGASGSWGNVPMPPHPDLKDEQLAEIVKWILSLKDVAPAPRQEAKAKQYTYTVGDSKT